MSNNPVNIQAAIEERNRQLKRIAEGKIEERVDKLTRALETTRIDWDTELRRVSPSEASLYSYRGSAESKLEDILAAAKRNQRRAEGGDE